MGNDWAICSEIETNTELFCVERALFIKKESN